MHLAQARGAAGAGERRAICQKGVMKGDDRAAKRQKASQDKSTASDQYAYVLVSPGGQSGVVGVGCRLSTDVLLVFVCSIG